MINREWQTVDVLTYTNSEDEYGQSRQNTPTVNTVQMVCKLQSQSLTGDMRYVDIDMIGITEDTSITDHNQVKINNVKYNVSYVIPSRRYTQVLMKKCQ